MAEAFGLNCPVSPSDSIPESDNLLEMFIKAIERGGLPLHCSRAVV